jgi:hopanoid biosynthesis associated protein HpnK
LKRLIVTADDFGAAREVNDAVEAAHLGGILTAASLMVGAPAASDAVARAHRMPSLRVGLHLVLTDGRPLLPPSAVPNLVDGSGHFRSGMVSAGAAMVFNPRARRQLGAEIAAQFEAFRATGLALDHCNAHKHFHLHPLIGSLMAKIGRRFGLRAVRVPLEPQSVLSLVEPGPKAAPAWLTAPWARLLRRRMAARGILTPDHVFGLRWSGAMTRARVGGLIRNLPEGLSEIYLHPATGGGFGGAAADYQYQEEFEALLAPETVAAARDPVLRLGGYADFLKSDVGGTVARISRNTGPNRSSTL